MSKIDTQNRSITGFPTLYLQTKVQTSENVLNLHQIVKVIKNPLNLYKIKSGISKIVKFLKNLSQKISNSLRHTLDL